MTQRNTNADVLQQRGASRWRHAPFRFPLEGAVSEYTGHAWTIQEITDLSDWACHPCAILSDGSFAVFAKYGVEPEAAEQFEIEIAGLRYLVAHAGVRTPTPIGIVPLERGTLFVMEALHAVERTPRHWREIGVTLARIHHVTAGRCGFPTHGYIGPLFQDNTPAQDWVTFFRERRLSPRLQIAVDSGNLPVSVAAQVETLIRRLPELLASDVTPSLLHGDAQQTNFITTAQGTFVIDPALYYGDRESDLALLDSFFPVPEEVFQGYNEVMPLDPGFSERRDLYRVPLYLAAVALEGPGHLGRLAGALQAYR